MISLFDRDIRSVLLLNQDIAHVKVWNQQKLCNHHIYLSAHLPATRQLACSTHCCSAQFKERSSDRIKKRYVDRWTNCCIRVPNRKSHMGTDRTISLKNRILIEAFKLKLFKYKISGFYSGLILRTITILQLNNFSSKA